jgi:hypothetical protein
MAKKASAQSSDHSQWSDDFSLPTPVAELYDVAPGVMQKFSCAEHGLIDLAEIDLQKAEQLAVTGYLIKKPL